MTLANVPPVVASYFLGWPPQRVRIALQNSGVPFGMAVKCGKTYSYHIAPIKLADYVGVKVEDIEAKARELDIKRGWRK